MEMNFWDLDSELFDSWKSKKKEWALMVEKGAQISVVAKKIVIQWWLQIMIM